MRHFLVGGELRCVLAAWMLLATSITSSVFSHSHNGGHDTHQHARWQCDLSRGPTGSTADHEQCAGAAIVASDAHHHGCFTLLGMVTHQSSTNKPLAPRESSPESGCGWMVAVWAAHGVRVTSGGCAVCPLAPGSLAGVATHMVFPPAQPRDVFAATAAAPPLCDRARHERSGVLLA